MQWQRLNSHVDRDCKLAVVSCCGHSVARRLLPKSSSPSRSGASGSRLQGAGGEKHVPAGSSHRQRHERLAGAHSGPNLAAPLGAAAPLRGPLHPAPAAPPGHRVQGLRPHGEGGDRQREFQGWSHARVSGKSEFEFRLEFHCKNKSSVVVK